MPESSLADWLLNDQETKRVDVLVAFAQVVGVAVLVVGLWTTWRSIGITQKQLSQEHQSGFAERFSRAVEQLGNKGAVTVRVAGVYALSGLEKESTSFHKPCIDTLLRFVRTSCDRNRRVNNHNWVPGSDVHAAIRAICERDIIGSDSSPEPLDFSNLILKGADFAKGSLEGASFFNSDIGGVIFHGALLCDADFKNSSGGAQFQNAELQGAKFNSASLEWASFSVEEHRPEVSSGAYLDLYPHPQKAIPEWKNKKEIQRKRGTRMNRTDFTGADLSHVNFKSEDLRLCLGLTSEQLAASITDPKTLLPTVLPKDMHALFAPSQGANLSGTRTSHISESPPGRGTPARSKLRRVNHRRKDNSGTLPPKLIKADENHDPN